MGPKISIDCFSFSPMYTSVCKGLIYHRPYCQPSAFDLLTVFSNFHHFDLELRMLPILNSQVLLKIEREKNKKVHHQVEDCPLRKKLFKEHG
jgi:hypothetical protein